jgi:hypothetical protein
MWLFDVFVTGLLGVVALGLICAFAYASIAIVTVTINAISNLQTY